MNFQYKKNNILNLTDIKINNIENEIEEDIEYIYSPHIIKKNTTILSKIITKNKMKNIFKKLLCCC